MFNSIQNVSKILIKPKKTSHLWDYFEEEVADSTSVICQVDNCKKKISRGKTGTDKSRLSNTGMRTHLMSCHGIEWQEFLKKDKKQNADKADEKEETLEADETENGRVSLFYLRNHKKRKSFFQQNLLI